jgi:Mannosyltransferase (PIG-V)
VVFFLVIAMYSAWRGGWAVGPRYLIPMLPFLTLPTIFTLDALASSRIPRDAAGLLYALVYGAFAISIVSTWAESISAAGGLWPDASNPNPLLSSLLPTVLQGGFLANQGTMQFGISGAASLFLLMALLTVWSLLMYMPPAVRWVNGRSGWLPPGEQPGWAAWRRRIARIPALASTVARLQRTQIRLRSASSGMLPAPPLAAAEANIGIRPEYVVLRRPDAGWQLALWLTVVLRAGLGLLGAWAVIAHGATPAGAWTELIIQDGKSWSDVLSSWQRWDALWYQQIAQNGYHAGNGTYHFGPLYPLLVHILALVLGGAPVVAELIITSLAFVVAMFLLYSMARLAVGPVTAALTVLLLALFPTGFLLLAPYSEGLLLALTLLAFRLAHDERPWAAGAAGLGAALVQPIGVLVMLPLVVEYAQSRRARGRRLGLGLLSAALPILGLLIVNAYLRISIGETHSYLPWDVVSRIPGNPVIQRGDPIEILNVICLAGFVILAIAAIKRLPVAYAVYIWPVLGLLIGSELRAPLTNMAHFALLLFPCFMILAIYLFRRPALVAGWLMLSLMFGAVLQVYWVRFAFLG